MKIMEWQEGLTTLTISYHKASGQFHLMKDRRIIGIFYKLSHAARAARRVKR